MTTFTGTAQGGEPAFTGAEDADGPTFTGAGDADGPPFTGAAEGGEPTLTGPGDADGPTFTGPADIGDLWLVQPRALIVTIYGLYARDTGGWFSVASLIRLLSELGGDRSGEDTSELP